MKRKGFLIAWIFSYMKQKINLVIAVKSDENQIFIESLLSSLDKILVPSNVDLKFVFHVNGPHLVILDKLLIISERDKRFLIIYTKNKLTPGAARNFAVFNNPCDYFMIIDSDDYFLESRLSSHLAAINLHDCDVHFNRLKIFSNDVEIEPLEEKLNLLNKFNSVKYKKINKLDLLIRCAPNNGSSIIKHTAFLAVGGYREDFSYSEDYFLWTRLYALGYNIFGSNDYGTLYRVSDFNSVLKRKNFLTVKGDILAKKNLINIFEPLRTLIALIFTLHKFLPNFLFKIVYKRFSNY
jgi:hypothetical protein